jgi:hypothetical protein
MVAVGAAVSAFAVKTRGVKNGGQHDDRACPGSSDSE